MTWASSESIGDECFDPLGDGVELDVGCIALTREDVGQPFGERLALFVETILVVGGRPRF